MTSINIEKTDSTPGFTLDLSKHIIEFSGESRPENVKSFFDPIIESLKEYGSYIYFLSGESTKNITIIVNFKLEYFNSSSAKYIVDIINLLNKIRLDSKKTDLTINWCYYEGDTDILDAGREFMTITNVKMSFVEI